VKARAQGAGGRSTIRAGAGLTGLGAPGAATSLGADVLGPDRPDTGVPDPDRPDMDGRWPGPPDVDARDIDAPDTTAPATRAPVMGVPAPGVPAPGVPALGVPEAGVPDAGVPGPGVVRPKRAGGIDNAAARRRSTVMSFSGCRPVSSRDSVAAE
jgi:hypothetical protein